MQHTERYRITSEILRRLNYCKEQSFEAKNLMVQNNYAEAAVCLDKQAEELKKVAQDCRLLSKY